MGIGNKAGKEKEDGNKSPELRNGGYGLRENAS